jgi:hypothetical protein
MDHYTLESYEIVRKRILEKIETLEGTGKTGSGDINNIKNWRRFGAAFAWDPEVYLDIMENPTMSDKDLMSALRSRENALMKKWQVIDKMPMHHIVALRTGGNLGLETEGKVWFKTRERIYQRFGFNPGNGPGNLNASSQMREGVHSGKDEPGGGALTNSADQETKTKVIQEIKQDEVILHRRGQRLGEHPDLYRKLIGATDKQQADYLEEYIIGQIQRFKKATAYDRTQMGNDAINDGISWFFKNADGSKIDAFSAAQSATDQKMVSALLKVGQYTDPESGVTVPLAQKVAGGFFGDSPQRLDPRDISLDFNTPQGRNFYKTVKAGVESSPKGHLRWVPAVGMVITGGVVMESLFGAREAYSKGNITEGNRKMMDAGAHTVGAVVGEVPFAGDAIVESASGRSTSDPEGYNVDGGQLFVDTETNEVIDDTSLHRQHFKNRGKQGLAYKGGKPVSIPYGSSEVGEGGLGNNIKRFAANMKKQASSDNPNDYGFTEALGINGPNQLDLFKNIQGFLSLTPTK